ncbi:helix-turn-helix domain-containing protein [Providencia rettgeri]|uniref:helix-turn-helix domain-containing protein n=1 Tax=Providencia rettgeri TaxID=587 RepID=UPI001CA70F2A|nr:helix-turn-helix transcriptional regulator [Providencia rettgeri]QZY63193.1 helix-turn-helix domain-containing protein [Providencia rettgeri]
MNTGSTASKLIGRNIKRLRCSEGYTASEFAKLTGCKSEQQVYRYERGINKIDIDTLVSMLSSLDVNVGSFFEQIVNEMTEGSDHYNLNI